ncbi:MAG: hypothetical protein KAR20_09530, partial [Candidatus Heimdallarchaeota archaeon]|nr:hypothetical protein [Candidatus Heimdallarchaeota archaeon]
QKNKAQLSMRTRYWDKKSMSVRGDEKNIPINGDRRIMVRRSQSPIIARKLFSFRLMLRKFLLDAKLAPINATAIKSSNMHILKVIFSIENKKYPNFHRPEIEKMIIGIRVRTIAKKIVF